MNIKTLIIDDEHLARSLVQNFLKADEQFEVIGEAADGFAGLKLINELKPDLVFLDIQMPKITGLEMLELIDEPPLVVFSTAYDQHAIEAFEKNAIDYLLKPYSKERFMKTLEKIKQKFQENVAKPDLSKIDLPAFTPQKTFERVVVKNGSKIDVILNENIVFLEAYGDYVQIHTATSKHLKQRTMKDFEAELPANFVRIHRSFLVNINFIQKLELYDKSSYLILLKTGQKLEVSRNGYKELKEILGW